MKKVYHLGAWISLLVHLPTQIFAKLDKDVFFISGRPITTLDRQQLKTLIQSTNINQTSLETEVLIAICHPTGDKWQLKHRFYRPLVKSV